MLKKQNCDLIYQKQPSFVLRFVLFIFIYISARGCAIVICNLFFPQTDVFQNKTHDSSDGSRSALTQNQHPIYNFTIITDGPRKTRASNTAISLAAHSPGGDVYRLDLTVKRSEG